MIYKYMKNKKKNEKKNILVIDNDQVWVDKIKTSLESLPCKVMFLKIPEEKKLLYPFIKNRSVDVVISEIALPEWDGFSEVKHLKEKFGGKVKIALTTKKLDTNLKAMALAFNADSFILKTSSKANIMLEIKKLI